MTFHIVSFEHSHYREARALWERTEGVGLSEADEEQEILKYLDRNPNTSFVATLGASVVGTLLCGHDGRRGLLHHLAVAAEHRRRGVGRTLVEEGMRALRAEGIGKYHLMVFADNEDGRRFWERVGAQVRTELELLSILV
jgi:N-acetylglutamate synthase